jgi:hypothetical protein
MIPKHKYTYLYKLTDHSTNCHNSSVMPQSDSCMFMYLQWDRIHISISAVLKALNHLKVEDIQRRVGGVAQVIERLPSKCEALSSNSSVTKKTPQNKKQNQMNYSFEPTGVTSMPRTL